MKKMGIYIEKKVLYYFALLFIGIFICFFLGESGPLLQKDSMGFLNANEGVENAYWLYVILLRFCKRILGEKFFLYGVWIFQGSLAVFTSFCLTEYIRKQYRLNEVLAVLVYVFSFLPYMYTLPENVVTHHILTEALAIPLMTLFFLFSLKVFLENRIKNMLLLAGVTILLILTRSQLRLILIVYLGIWIFIGLQEVYVRIDTKLKKVFWGMLLFLCLCGVLGSVFVLRVLITQNLWPQLTDAVAGRTLCTIEYKDKALFNEKDKEMFDYIYQLVDEKHQRTPYFRDDTWKGYDIAYASNENVKIYFDNIAAYCYEKNPEVGAGPMQEIIEQARVDFVSTLFSANIWKYILMTIQLLPQSYVASIFIQPDAIHEICYYITAFLYICALVLIIYCVVKKIEWKYCIPMVLTLYTISLNNIITNLLFYGQQRYVIYSFGAFYISIILLLKGIHLYIENRNKTFEEREIFSTQI